jgi:hypothetical protein
MKIGDITRMDRQPGERNAWGFLTQAICRTISNEKNCGNSLSF